MTQYKVYLNNSRNIYNWIKSQPNIISISRENDIIFCEFTHTAEEEATFQQEIANRMFQVSINDVTMEYILDKIESIQTDSLIYITELSQTRTDIGTTFIDLYNDYGGRNFFVDLTGYKK